MNSDNSSIGRHLRPEDINKMLEYLDANVYGKPTMYEQQLDALMRSKRSTPPFLPTPRTPNHWAEEYLGRFAEPSPYHDMLMVAHDWFASVLKREVTHDGVETYIRLTAADMKGIKQWLSVYEEAESKGEV